MSLKSSLLYLPPNLRDPAVTPLYPNVTDVYDKALELAYLSEINKLSNLYNPASEYYDTDYVLDMLGENTLANLLSDVTDKISLTMIVSDIQNIKGTKKAFDAILKLIKIDYKQILYTILPNGCTEVTLILNSATRVDITTISDLIKFSQEVFPLCLNLSAVTNCITYDSSLSYTGYRELDFGQHVLDRTFVLDMSKLDTTYGKTVTTSAGSINVLLCNPTLADADATLTIGSDVTYVNNLTTNFLYTLSAYPRLDVDLILDKNVSDGYFGASTYISTVKNLDMTYTGYDASLFGVRTNVTQFRLDRDNLDRFFYHRLDGVLAFTPKIGMDFNYHLDKTPLDSPGQGETQRYTSLYVRSQNVDSFIDPVVNSIFYTQNYFYDSPSAVSTDSSVLVARTYRFKPTSVLSTTSATAFAGRNRTNSSRLSAASTIGGRLGAGYSLDFSKPADSMYVPAFGI